MSDSVKSSESHSCDLAAWLSFGCRAKTPDTVPKSSLTKSQGRLPIASIVERIEACEICSLVYKVLRSTLSLDDVQHNAADGLHLCFDWEPAAIQHLCAIGSNQIDDSGHAWVPRLQLITDGDTTEVAKAANATLQHWVFWVDSDTTNPFGLRLMDIDEADGQALNSALLRAWLEECERTHECLQHVKMMPQPQKLFLIDVHPRQIVSASLTD